jgi:hypothetical protein
VYAAALSGARIQVSAVDEDGVWAAPVLVRNILARVVTPPPQPEHEHEKEHEQEQEREQERDKEREKERDREEAREGRGQDNALHQPRGFGDNGMPRYSTRFDDNRRDASVHLVDQSQNRPERNLAPVSSEIRVAQSARSDQAKAALQVRNVVLTDRGLRVRFNQAIDARKLQPEGLVVMRGDEQVRGVLVPDPDGEGFRFESASGAMEPGEYRVMLKAESGAFITPDGLRLDGDGDGISGGDFRGQARVGKATARGEERPDSGAAEPDALDPAARNLLVNGGLGGALSLALGQSSLSGRGRTARRRTLADALEPVRLRERTDEEFDFAIQTGLPAADTSAAAALVNNWEIRL